MAPAKKKPAAKKAPAKKAAARRPAARKAAAPARKRVAVAADDQVPVRRRVVDEPNFVTDPEDEGPDSAPTEVAQAARYFIDPTQKTDLSFYSSGAATLDCALGGGYVLGRVVNLVGDRSAGKTLLAIEACANFHISFGKAGMIRYAESEHAFDKPYAAALGMPVEVVEFVDEKAPLRTVEDWYADFSDFMARCKAKRRKGLYVLDSLDALSDDAELKRDMDDGTYGANKAKKLGELFRRAIADMDGVDCALIVVSQLKDKIGVTFGEKQTRTGGRALDYYATHIIWLADIGKIRQTKSGIERVIGVKVKARIKKNKVGLPFRDCEYPILFGYGVDDLTSCVEWLISAKRANLLKDAPVSMSQAGYSTRIQNLIDKGGEPVREVRRALRELVVREWQEVEKAFLPKSSKY